MFYPLMVIDRDDIITMISFTCSALVRNNPQNIPESQTLSSLQTTTNQIYNIIFEKKWGVLVKSGDVLVKSGGVLVKSGAFW